MEDVVDVCVIGAGWSGLVGAKALMDANIQRIVVLEAKDRVGGRTYSVDVQGAPVDLGAGYVGPTQDRVLRVARSYSQPTYKVYNQGKHVYVHPRTKSISRFERDNYPLSIPVGMLDANAMICQVDKDAASINVTEPWKSPKALEFDSITLKEWAERRAWHADTKKLVEVMAENVTGALPENISYLYWLRLVASAGRTGFVGTLNRLVDISNGAQERKLKGGCDLVPKKIAAELGPNVVKVSCPVTRIDRATAPGGAITVTYHDRESKSTKQLLAKKVVLAMAPFLYNKIEFHPPLPYGKVSLGMHQPLGTVMKTITYYKTPWWRKMGLSGQAICSGGPVTFCMDDCKDDTVFAIMGFINGRHQMEILDKLSRDERRRLVTSQYATVFQTQKAVAEVVDYIDFSWVSEPFSWGCVGWMAPGVLTQWGKDFATVVDGNIHFAGAEAATHWVGYLDGAVQAGERCAREIAGDFATAGRKDVDLGKIPAENEAASMEVPPVHHGPGWVERTLVPGVGTALVLAAAASLAIASKL